MPPPSKRSLSLAGERNARAQVEEKLAKEKAATAKLKGQLAELRRQHAAKVEAIGADHTRRVAEVRGQLREVQAARAEAEGQAATLAGELDQARIDHETELAEVREQAQTALANETAQFEAVTAQLERNHASEVERLAKAPSAKRAADAEQARKAAEAKLAETTRRLEGELAEVREYSQARQQELRQLLATARAEHTHAQAQVIALRADLDQAHAKVAELQARLEPPQPDMMVPVKWLKDSPAEGCHIGDRVYTGRGPRYERSAHLGPDGALVTPLARDGDLERMPLGVAKVLQASGHVHIVGPAVWRADLDAAMSGLEVPRTPEELRTRARQLEMFAEQLERADAEQVEHVSA